jgi:hypothetical protein
MILDLLYIATAAAVGIALALTVHITPKEAIPTEPWYLACYTNVCFS